MKDKVLKATEEKIDKILEEGINNSNLNYLYQLVDIQKDMHEIERSESMNYGRYDSYGARMRDSRGRYMESDYDTRYRGHNYLDAMYDHYGRYEEGRGAYNRGNYGVKDETLEGLECMLEATADFFNMIKKEATSPEEQKLVEKYTHKMMR